MLQATNSIPNGGPEDPLFNNTQFISLSIVGLILFFVVFFLFLKSNFKKGNSNPAKIEF